MVLADGLGPTPLNSVLCRPSWEANMTDSAELSRRSRVFAQVATIGLAWMGLATGRPLVRFNFGADWATLPATSLVLFPVALYWVARAVQPGLAGGVKLFLAYGAGLVAAGISVLVWMGNAKMGEDGNSDLARTLSGVAIALWVVSVGSFLFSMVRRGPTEGASGN